MDRLSVNYLGLTLKSPLIISSCGLTSSLENLLKAEESGAGAVVLKSLFEEQITHHINTLAYTSGHPESDDYIANYTKSQSVDEYLSLVSLAKKNLKIPVIPSINCYSSEGWTSFARKVADSGADALEINIFFLPVDKKKSSSEAEKIYFDVIEKLKRSVSIPIAIKIGFRFSNLFFMIDQFYNRKVEGVVMFNRFYEPDFDIDKMTIIPAPVFSRKEEQRYVLRWIGMASAQKIKIDISASTGVHSGEDAIKYILAGADTVQVCSALYRKGIPYLETMNRQITEWMEKKNFRQIGDFKGRLNYLNIEKPSIFERTQFMKYFSSMD